MFGINAIKFRLFVKGGGDVNVLSWICRKLILQTYYGSYFHGIEAGNDKQKKISNYNLLKKCN